VSSPHDQSAPEQPAIDLTSEVIAVVRSAVPDHETTAIDVETSLGELGFDSVDLVELSVRLEEHFRFVLDDSNGRRVKTVSDVVALVEENTTAEVPRDPVE
jgi:acyl carrier protein